MIPALISAGRPTALPCWNNRPYPSALYAIISAADRMRSVKRSAIRMTATYEDWCRSWIEALEQVPLGTHPVRENPLSEHVTVSID